MIPDAKDAKELQDVKGNVELEQCGLFLCERSTFDPGF